MWFDVVINAIDEFQPLNKWMFDFFLFGKKNYSISKTNIILEFWVPL